jgi:hypothetical protein
LSSTKSLLITQPKDYFREMVGGAFEARKLKTIPLAQEYMVGVLVHYIFADKLENNPTLAEMMLEATSSSTGIRTDRLKQLGDLALYVSGFFGDSLSRKLVDIDYYANMGGLAYTTLSQHTADNDFRMVFREYGDNFLDFVEVLTYISHQTQVQTDQNLLRLYDRYLKTGSRIAREQLVEKGIVPPEDMIPGRAKAQ